MSAPADRTTVRRLPELQVRDRVAIVVIQGLGKLAEKEAMRQVMDKVEASPH